ncbi:mediator of RNA polymerase II transcription subunit 15a [Tripterygium wilfordii]|uniref:mediator of RNA polymerase II transcription subunit 15a n=1 Tax=Tripterygium wilfordii TaxID=458696 RepID=UPI0018F808CE|nr:mediator of RNA polymerase II transcription subunit 15a [Tripterygium wilfordii]XP_038692759.1 mediator of RNA polymerase II transcription subunit 15a [Tripterygium wilfordii]
MATNNWRPNPPGGEPARDTGDWRAQLPPDSGRRLIGKRKSLDSPAQTGHDNEADWQEEVYQKIKSLKETYLPELNEMHQKIAAKFQKNESLPQFPKPEQLEKLKVVKAMLERIINFLLVPKHGILPNFKEKLGSYEKQIINFIISNRPRKLAPCQQLGGPGQLLPTQMHSMQQSQSQLTLIQSHENPINPPTQSMNIQGPAATMHQNSMANLQQSFLSQQNMMNSLQPGSNLEVYQTDWQEEVYQKIKAMKETYLPELNEMHQKLAAKSQKNESLRQPLKPDHLEKMKVFMAVLERIITFLLVPKHGIQPNFEEKLGYYEKQIINFINSNRPRKPAPSEQLGGPGQLLPAQMHSMQHSQSQQTQIQSHENLINPQAQSMNLQGSAATMHQNSMQHSSLSQQDIMNSLQPGSNLDSGQGNALISTQQVPVGSRQQNPVSAPQQVNMNALSTQSEVPMLQQNINPL